MNLVDDNVLKEEEIMVGENDVGRDRDATHSDLVESRSLPSVGSSASLEHSKSDTVGDEGQALCRGNHSHVSSRPVEGGDGKKRLTVFFETQLSNRIEYPTSDDIDPT